MANPTRILINNGSISNDGTGDTLRDAATKINDNFAQLWLDTYSPKVDNPGRYYTCRTISAFTVPDSGEFVVSRTNWDSGQVFKFHPIDKGDRKVSYAGTDSEFASQITLWQKDTSNALRLDDWKMVAVIDGNASYHEDSGFWRFEKTDLVAKADELTDSSDSNRNDYYIKLHGVW